MSTIENIPQFWWLKHYIRDNSYDVGHPLFSLIHIFPFNNCISFIEKANDTIAINTLA